MMRYKYGFLILFLFLFYSCNKNKENTISVNNNFRFKIEISKDTVFLNEYVKGIVSLENPFFKKEDSKIVLVLEFDENYPLKKDLSNEYDIPIESYHNLSHDTFNQQWFEEYNFNKSSAFQRKFSTTGNKTIRGYVLEYISKDPPMDSITDKEKYRKYFFEKEVFVKDTINETMIKIDEKDKI